MCYDKIAIFDQYIAYWWSVECCQEIPGVDYDDNIYKSTVMLKRT